MSSSSSSSSSSDDDREIIILTKSSDRRESTPEVPPVPWHLRHMPLFTSPDLVRGILFMSMVTLCVLFPQSGHSPFL